MVIQSDFLTESESVLVCLITSTVRDAPQYRLDLPANKASGLRAPSQVMVDKIMAVRRDRCGPVIGQLERAQQLALGRLLAFAIGLAD